MAVASLCLALWAAPPVPVAPATSKKEAYLAQKAAGDAASSRPTRVGRKAHRPVWARNLHTSEIAPLDGPGALTPQAWARFFRDWFTADPGPLPTPLIARVLSAAKHFRVREVRIVSAFRAPKYNLMLRKKGREVALKSQHTQAHAIDFWLPDVDTRSLYDWLLERHDGGVGFYPISAFVHIDVGKKRTWKGT